MSADTSVYFQDKNIFGEYFEMNLVNQELVNDDLIQSIIRLLPTSFYIENDTIRYVIESELPSPYIFREFIKKKH